VVQKGDQVVHAFYKLVTSDDILP